MGVLLGLTTGIGLLLVWSAFTLPAPLGRPGPALGRTEALLARAGAGNLRARTFICTCLACGLAAGALVLGITATGPVAAVFAGIGAYLPVAVLQGRAHRRQREFAEVWPEAIDHLASAVRAGLSLPEALAGLAERGPAALRPAFASFAADYRATGRFGDALDRLKHLLADPVGDRVIEGIRVAREVGGGELGRLLRNLSGYLRDDLRTRSELESRQAWAVNGARLAVACPWLVLLFMSSQPEVIGRYRSPAGAVVLAGGALLCVVAYRVMMRIGRLPVERRILR